MKKTITERQLHNIIKNVIKEGWDDTMKAVNPSPLQKYKTGKYLSDFDDETNYNQAEENGRKYRNGENIGNWNEYLNHNGLNFEQYVKGFQNLMQEVKKSPLLKYVNTERINPNVKNQIYQAIATLENYLGNEDSPILNAIANNMGKSDVNVNVKRSDGYGDYNQTLATIDPDGEVNQRRF